MWIRQLALVPEHARTTPLINGHSQIESMDRCSHDERDGLDIARRQRAGDKSARRLRAVIVTPDYFVDEVRWSAETHVRFELPVHFGEAHGEAEEQDVSTVVPASKTVSSS